MPNLDLRLYNPRQVTAIIGILVEKDDLDGISVLEVKRSTMNAIEELFGKLHQGIKRKSKEEGEKPEKRAKSLAQAPVAVDAESSDSSVSSDGSKASDGSKSPSQSDATATTPVGFDTVLGATSTPEPEESVPLPTPSVRLAKKRGTKTPSVIWDGTDLPTSLYNPPKKATPLEKAPPYKMRKAHKKPSAK